ncbi:MAG: FMN-binding protein [Rhodoluna sp.]|nr:FMN-binding protein [Rhodoluna sp.]
MRKSTQVLMGALSLVSVAVGVEIGATAKPSGIFTPSPTPTTTDPTTTPKPTTPNPTPTSPTPKPTTPTPKPTPKPTKPPAVVSHQSNAVSYRFGTVQLTVTKTGTKITDINMDRAGATNGRAASFPYLVSLALQAQSGSFDTSMMSGATYSTDAFMQALNNALGKF